MTHTPHHFETQLTQAISLNYLLYLPPSYGDDSAQRWPLILSLHGSGERGDNLELVKLYGLPAYLETGHDLPFVVISPQCPANSYWTMQFEALNALLADVLAHYPIDENRVYLTGLSMGGGGTWTLAAAYPQRFAAIAPICGRAIPPLASNFGSLPIWVFHGEADDVVPVGESLRMVDALKAIGANVKLTTYPGVGHDSWTQTYANPELYNWLLSHKRP